jgi:hypothetical protein
MKCSHFTDVRNFLLGDMSQVILNSFPTKENGVKTPAVQENRLEELFIGILWTTDFEGGKRYAQATGMTAYI